MLGRCGVAACRAAFGASSKAARVRREGFTFVASYGCRIVTKLASVAANSDRSDSTILLRSRSVRYQPLWKGTVTKIARVVAWHCLGGR